MGDICRRSAALWVRQLEVGMLLITKCQMSADANNYNLQNVECHSAMSARLWIDSGLRHNAFKKPGLQTFRLPYHFIVASQWSRNLAFTAHAECYIVDTFRAAIKFFSHSGKCVGHSLKLLDIV